MSPGMLDEYISRLERELRKRGVDDPRILAEAREHLVDAVEEGRQRGLSVDEAEQEALGRFGGPAIVAAAHADEERHRMTGFSGALGRARQRKWWILVPTALAAIITSVTSSFTPARYRSETTILVVPQRRSPDYARPTVSTRVEDRLRSISQQVRSRTRLERVIEELNLYADRRKTDTMQNIVDDMSQAISVDIVKGDVFRVGFSSDSPRTAQQVAERLAAFLIDEQLRNRTLLVESTSDSLESQIDDMRNRILTYETTLDELRAQNRGRPLSQADLLPYEVLKERYKTLLIRSEEARIASNLERRQIGEQYRILDPARLPEAPENPNRVSVTLIGALVGLLTGLALVMLRRPSNGAPPTFAEA